MARARITLALAVAALAVLPASAMAKPLAQPLRDVAPLGSSFKDRVSASNPRLAKASFAAGSWAAYRTPGGTTIQAAISDRYANRLDTSVVQTYVDFLDSLDHGLELGTLKIYIAPPTEVTSECGGQSGTLACYDSGTKVMVVPGEPTDTGSSGVTTSYVVAHEYGHHIAAARDNAPFNSFRVGPKYWSSYERVCYRTLQGLLAPGNEQELYLSNPGESWAETYAQLKYPEVSWQYTQLLKPDATAFAAARRDVLDPWPGNVVQTFKGSFGRRGASAKSFRFNLTLDGVLSLRLKGPRKANYDLRITSDAGNGDSTHAAGSRDSVRFESACRSIDTEHVTVTVKRVSGSGPFALRTTYAG